MGQSSSVQEAGGTIPGKNNNLVVSLSRVSNALIKGIKYKEAGILEQESVFVNYLSMPETFYHPPYVSQMLQYFVKSQKSINSHVKIYKSVHLHECFMWLTSRQYNLLNQLEQQILQDETTQENKQPI